MSASPPSDGVESFIHPAIGEIILIIGLITMITICYFKATKKCFNYKMEPQIPDHEDPLDETVDRCLHNMSKQKPHRYTSEQLQYYTRNYFHKLGSGGFGVVYRGLLPDGIPMAVKVLKNSLTKQVKEQFMAEVNSIGRTYHCNLVRLYGYCFETNLKALVYELLPNGSLDQLLFAEPRPVLDWGKRFGIAVGIAKGIAYLHEACEEKIVHHDIKPGNILLDSGLNPKVADFGLAQLRNKDSSHFVMSGFKGTPGYAAPEMWTSYVTHKCDVYSFGMMLFEIVGRRRNHVKELSGTTKEWLPRWIYQNIRDGEEAELLAEFGVEVDGVERVLKAALWCVQYCPRDRPEMSVVVKMLEGGMDVPLPPNPFDYLERNIVFEGSGCVTDTTSFSSQDLQIEKCNTFPQVDETKIDVGFQRVDKTL